MINYRTFEPSDLAGVRAVLEALGWEQRGQTGSHIVYVKPVRTGSPFLW